MNETTNKFGVLGSYGVEMFDQMVMHVKVVFSLSLQSQYVSLSSQNTSTPVVSH